MGKDNGECGETEASTDGDAEPNGADRYVDRRRFLQTTAAGTAGVSMAGCLDAFGTGSDDEGGDLDSIDTIKIGVLAPEPENNPIGASQAQAAELAVQELNDDGGIAGKDVELIVKNTHEDPAQGQQAYQELTLEENVHATAGVFTSEVLLNIMGDIAEQQTLHLTTGAASTEASARVNEDYEENKYHFRVGPLNDKQLGQNLIDFADANFSDMGWESVGVLVEDYTWTEPISEVLESDLGDTGVDVPVNTRYASGTENFGPIYDNVENEDVDAAFVAMAHTGTEAVVQWASQQRDFAFGGIHVPMQLPAYYGLVDSACRWGITQTSATAQSELTEKTQPFVQAYGEMFDGLPVYTGYITYDAIKLYAQAVEDEETVNSDDLVEPIEDMSFTGTTGTIEFYPPDHEFAHDVVYGEDKVFPIYAQWQENDDGEGVQEVIWPDEHSTADYVPPAWL